MSKDALAAIRTQVMWNRLIAVVEEQAQTLMRTAFSPIVREAGDLANALFDRRGRMVAQAVTGTPGHICSVSFSMGPRISGVRRGGAPGVSSGDLSVTLTESSPIAA